jgi:hypothetical protein
MNSNNRSWISSSSLGDDESTEGESHNTSANSGGGLQRKKSRGDRYNHYRRETPGKVRPWMRDKAVTGSGRFGGSSSALRGGKTAALPGEAASIGSNNSCANSVCSNSSFPDPASTRSIFSTDIPTDEDTSMMTNRQEDISMMTNSVVTAHDLDEEEEEESHVDVRYEKEEGTLCLSADEEETIVTVNHIPSSHKPAENQYTSQLSHEPEDETETVDTEVDSVLDTRPGDAEEDDAKNWENIDQDKPQVTAATDIVPALQGMTEPIAAPMVDEESAKDESRIDAFGYSISPSNNFQSNPERPPVDTDLHFEEDLKTPMVSNRWKSKLVVPAEPSYKAPDDEPCQQNEEEKSHKEEVYDVLASVQPSTYNPMAFVASRGSEKPSMAAYVTLQKPSPLVKEQAALLNDAIEEELSFEEEEEEVQNLSGESLQGIKALDTTREESVLEMDDLNVSAEEDEFFKMVSVYVMTVLYASAQLAHNPCCFHSRLVR